MRVPVSDTLGQQVSAALEQEILSGAISPGQRLNADELAHAFGVSRIPVREALQSLKAAGWVEIRPRYGTFVRQHSLQELDDLFHVRGIMEAETARMAAAFRTEPLLEAIGTAHDDLVRSIGVGDPVVVAEANSRFHRAVADASGNQVLADLTDLLAKRIRWYFATVARSRASHSAEEHSEILAAIREGDGRTAAKLAKAHVARTSTLIREALRYELDGEATAAPPGRRSARSQRRPS